MEEAILEITHLSSLSEKIENKIAEIFGGKHIKQSKGSIYCGLMQDRISKIHFELLTLNSKLDSIENEKEKYNQLNRIINCYRRLVCCNSEVYDFCCIYFNYKEEEIESNPGPVEED